ncbi:hypothetical protein T484DRAFT_1865462 [Baffinella frigidus]|nr:hypothetical protein T484DRAFT_1865462 [Cryptophyta sp. CCMP2293]
MLAQGFGLHAYLGASKVRMQAAASGVAGEDTAGSASQQEIEGLRAQTVGLEEEGKGLPPPLLAL